MRQVLTPPPQSTQPRPEAQSPSVFLVVQTVPTEPSLQVPLKLLHWFWHSALRRHGCPSASLLPQVPATVLQTSPALQLRSIEHGCPLSPVEHLPTLQIPLRQSRLKSQNEPTASGPHQFLLGRQVMLPDASLPDLGAADLADRWDLAAQPDPLQCPVGVADGCCPSPRYGGSDPDCPSLACMKLDRTTPIELDVPSDSAGQVAMTWLGRELALAWTESENGTSGPKGFVVFQRRGPDGAWKIAADMDNTNAQPQAPGPEPAAADAPPVAPAPAR